jgi:toxin FitB
MFVLDTTVVSELRKVRAGKASPHFAAWADNHDAADMFLSCIAILELEICILQVGRRDSAQAAALRTWLDDNVVPEFPGRIVCVDTLVAQRCARLHVPAPRNERDALIAATALIHGMAVVTRNVADFAPTGVGVVNPWDAM